MWIREFCVAQTHALRSAVHILQEMVDVEIHVVLVFSQVNAFDFFLGNGGRYLSASQFSPSRRNIKWLQGSPLKGLLHRCHLAASVHATDRAR